MKKISMIFTFVSLIATKSFAADPVLVVSVPDPYITDTGSTMTLAITGDTAGIGMMYIWQYFDRDSVKWKNINGTDNNPQLTVFQQSFAGSRAFRVEAHNRLCHYWPSNTVTLCQYALLAIGGIDISGGIGPNGEAVLQFNQTTYLRVMLQVSADLQKTWTDVLDVTGQSSYVGHERVTGILFYRLEALQDDGTKKYGKPYRIKEILPDEGIDFKKPINAMFAIDIAGKLVGNTLKDVTVGGPKQAFDRATNGLSFGVYRVVCIQGYIRKVVCTIKQ